MPKIVRVALVGYLLFCVATLAMCLHAYGGLTGNVPPSYSAGPYNDSLPVFRIVFNKWYLNPEDDPLLFRVFMLLNTPSVLTAWGVYTMLSSLLPTFQKPYPFGLSTGTYTYGLTFLISPFQWLLVGYLVRALLRRWSIAPKWTDT